VESCTFEPQAASLGLYDCTILHYILGMGEQRTWLMSNKNRTAEAQRTQRRREEGVLANLSESIAVIWW
jgi:hypothetical protein